MYDCEFTIAVEDESKEGKGGEIVLTDVNNHEVDSDFEFEFKFENKGLLAKVKGSKKEIQNSIKLLFNAFWESQKK